MDTRQLWLQAREGSLFPCCLFSITLTPPYFRVWCRDSGLFQSFVQGFGFSLWVQVQSSNILLRTVLCCNATIRTAYYNPGTRLHSPPVASQTSTTKDSPATPPHLLYYLLLNIRIFTRLLAVFQARMPLGRLKRVHQRCACIYTSMSQSAHYAAAFTRLFT